MAALARKLITPARPRLVRADGRALGAPAILRERGRVFELNAAYRAAHAAACAAARPVKQVFCEDGAAPPPTPPVAFPAVAYQFLLSFEDVTAGGGEICILQRASDDDLESFDFVGGTTPWASIDSWRGGADALVQTFRDKSGNARDWTQTTKANMCKLNTSLKCLDFSGAADGTLRMLNSPTVSIAQPFSTFAVLERNGSSTAAAAVQTASASNGATKGWAAANQYRISSNNTTVLLGSFAGIDTGKHRVLAQYQGATSAIYSDNGAPVTGDAGAANQTRAHLGSSLSTGFRSLCRMYLFFSIAFVPTAPNRSDWEAWSIANT